MGTAEGALIVSILALLISGYSIFAGRRERDHRQRADAAAELDQALLAYDSLSSRISTELITPGDQLVQDFTAAGVRLQSSSRGVPEDRIEAAVSAFREAADATLLVRDEDRSAAFDKKWKTRDAALELILKYRRKQA